jgi:hypothetical protein
MCAMFRHPSAPRLRARASEPASACGGGGGLPPLPLLPSLLSSLLSLPRPAREQPMHHQHSTHSAAPSEQSCGGWQDLDRLQTSLDDQQRKMLDAGQQAAPGLVPGGRMCGLRRRASNASEASLNTGSSCTHGDNSSGAA